MKNLYTVHYTLIKDPHFFDDKINIKGVTIPSHIIAYTFSEAVEEAKYYADDKYSLYAVSLLAENVEVYHTI